MRYAFQVSGPLGEGVAGWDSQGGRWTPELRLLDPYAPLVAGRDVFGDTSKPSSSSLFTGTFDFASPPFDWQGVQPPAVPQAQSVVYEMSVRGFTRHASSGVPEAHRGGYLGVIDKIPHLLSLGVTAVELLPAFEFDELEFQRDPSSPRAHMVNVWGYSTVAFLAPMSRFATPTGEGPACVREAVEFKTMVRELHRAGIEVFLDVVYNHTAEGGDGGEPYTLSMRGIDNSEYYIVDPQRPRSEQMLNFSGCGNTLSANGTPGRRLVLDSLRHWVSEYHVDGFRFDLASALTRRPVDGAPLSAPPVIRDISLDPLLSRCKLIAEPWDAAGLYQVGSFPNWDRWAEWNGRWRDTVRCFVRGDAGQKPQLATRLAGSADMYAVNQRRPWASLNFVTAHDGFTLADLVSYSAKRNGGNGEGGRDGTNDNFSWNCGCEGPSGDEGVAALRLRQRKNFLLALMVSQGTPMLLSGDEFGATKAGNNNTYGLDGPLNDLDWSLLKTESEASLFRFASLAIALRKACPLLRSEHFLGPQDVTWHEKRWEDAESRCLAWTLHDRSGTAGGSLYVAFNAHGFPLTELPLPAPPDGCAWHRLVDTSLPSPRDIDLEASRVLAAGAYTVAPHSAVVLRAAKVAA